MTDEQSETLEEMVVSILENTTRHGAMQGKTQTNDAKFYNLDAIISVGYRINSVRATQFRQWATSVLRTFAVQGYVLDKKRLENGQIFDEEYFEHLLDEIREIRASERKFYQKITDIYSTAVDYSVDAVTTKNSLRQYKTSCISPYTGIRLPSLS